MIVRTTAILLLLPGLSWAQNCARDSTPPSVSGANFSYETGESTNSVAYDKRTGLRWRRCALGQNWNNAQLACENDPTVSKKYTWRDALMQAQNVWEGQSGWRLPNVKEIMSIVDTQCSGPPLNSTVFPDAPISFAGGYWTSTPYQVIEPGDSIVQAWLVTGVFGEVKPSPVALQQFVYLVK